MPKKILEIHDKTIFDGIFVKYILKYFFLAWFKLSGWRTTLTAPEGAGVTVAAPHTSNWDFFYALGAAVILDVKIYFSIKDTWCRIPVIGNMMMGLGAIPIDRRPGAKGQIAQIRKLVEKHKNSRVFFVFTPEGTRSKVKKWKTGFYHVAEHCGLPIFLAKVDYKIKESGVFHTYQLTGDKEEDIKAIQASYSCVFGKTPKWQFPQYTGHLPNISDTEALIIRALYSFKGVATQIEIAGKVKLTDLSTSMFDFLIEKGMLEQVFYTEGDAEPHYKLTFTGRGYLLHLYPTLT